MSTSRFVHNMRGQHTPGPWTIQSHENRLYVGPVEIGGEEDEDLANACLIAAAPDLLAALRKAADYMGEMYHPADVLEEARAAIAKATGRERMGDEVSRKLPDGSFTSSTEGWTKAWTDLGSKFCEAIGKGQAYAFDPDIGIIFKDGTPSIMIPVWLAERVIALDEKGVEHDQR
jgi:hypothetical protein